MPHLRRAHTHAHISDVDRCTNKLQMCRLLACRASPALSKSNLGARSAAARGRARKPPLSTLQLLPRRVAKLVMWPMQKKFRAIVVCGVWQQKRRKEQTWSMPLEACSLLTAEESNMVQAVECEACGTLGLGLACVNYARLGARVCSARCKNIAVCAREAVRAPHVRSKHAHYCAQSVCVTHITPITQMPARPLPVLPAKGPAAVARGRTAMDRRHAALCVRGLHQQRRHRDRQ